MSAQFFDRLAKLEREHASYAIATVVARQSPVSAHLGDRALIFADGHMDGFVGGSCARDIVRRQALAALGSRHPVLLQIRPANAPAGHEHCVAIEHPDALAGSKTERVVIPMSCASEGAVDVYIEPRIPLRRLVVVGFTPVAEALAQTAAALAYNVVRVVVDHELRDLGAVADARVIALGALREFLASLEAREREALVAIVASQGHYDELALEMLQTFDVAFIGLLASRRRARTVFGVLAQQGVAPDRIARIRNPVGLDIGARSPGEVAVSILAEIIANAAGNRDAEPGAVHVDVDVDVDATAVDPVCGMTVDTPNALHRLDYAGRTLFFCCAGCQAAFAADPAAFAVGRGSA